MLNMPKNRTPAAVSCTFLVLSICALVLPSGCDNVAAKMPLHSADEPAGNLAAKALQIIEAGLVDENPQVRANAVEVVADTKQMKLMPKVQQLLRDDLVPVRFSAACAVGDVEFTPAKNDVARLVKDSDENVSIAAAYAMYKLGSARGLDTIRKVIKSSNQQTRANGAFLLGKSGDKGSLELLYWAMRDEDSDDKVRLNAAEAIARLGDEQIYQKLWTMLISTYADVRVCGVRAMGALGTTRARDTLITMLDDDMAEVRLVAAEQLGMLGDTTGEPAVLAVLANKAAPAGDTEARQRLDMLTALAIGRIGTPALKKHLPELLNSPSKYVRLAAAKAVIECGRHDNIGL